MHLKHIEIVGFKSFCDRVKLDLGQGITAIVGPNGCGKSNIIDAIRWCLGEMSAKSLRSNLMLDVVFNGSGSRPAQNMSEVTLTFDNSDKRLPIDYTDVSITRRLFRSGESEYYINKTQCRLRDIKELFLDTGMGEDGYSSMEQGKVEWVLQAKPEQRRELFEEAAGVSKYRARREEAVRKLDKVDLDLSRISDIVSVTRDQIRKLENAVNRAKTYQRIKEELRTMEVGDWIHQVSVLKTDVEKLEVSLTEDVKKVEELNTQIHVQDAEIASLRLDLTRIEEGLVQANASLAAIDADIKISQERIHNAEVREQDLIRQSVSLENNIQRERARIDELSIQQQTQEQILKEIMAQGESFETEYATSKRTFEEHESLLEKKRVQIKIARDKILERVQARARIQQQMSSMASEAARIESQVQNAEKEKEKVMSELLSSTSLHEADAKEVEELRTNLARQNSMLEELSIALKAISDEMDQCERDRNETAESVARLKGQIHSIEAQQAEDPYLAGAQAVMSMNLPGIFGPINRLFQCSELDRDMMVSALGEHLGDLVAETAVEAEKALKELASSGKGRARIWILEKVTSVSLSGAVEGLAHDHVIGRIRCDSKFMPLFQLLSAGMIIQDTHIYANAYINGGVAPGKWKSHTLLRLPELESDLLTAETKKASLDQRIQHLMEQQLSQKERRDNAEKERNGVLLRLKVKESELNKLSLNLKILQEENGLLETEIKQLKENQSVTQQKAAEFQNSFNELQTQEKIDHDELDQLHQQLPELQQAHAKANADLSSKSEKYKAHQEKLTWQQSVIDHTAKELEALIGSREHQHKVLTQIATDTGVARTSQQESKTALDAALLSRVQAQEQVNQIQVSRTDVSDKASGLLLSLNELRRQYEEIQQRVQSGRIEEASMKGRLDSIVQRLQDQYELTVDTAQAQFTPVAANLEELERLKKRISNIGPLNLAAPQEHQELSEKLTFLSTQQDDLIKAKDDLKLVISKINATTKEHFKETFEKVRQNFRTIYSQMFRGGEADLRLTDENDILSAGIDIYCTPPGKKVMHISLLSGGEKALTACSLLFAFFQVRPSPLALLDEVDAPLDEANVLRFVDLIKLFSEKSQFLVVSHNKRTMEAANTLYGVTMEELGVSRVLSAHLARDKKKIEKSIEDEKAAPVA